RRKTVDIDLGHASCDHRQGGEGEAEGDALNGSEVDARLAECWVHDKVHEGDKDDDGDWVEVLDDVVRDAVEFHDTRDSLVKGVVKGKASRNLRGLRCQVPGHLSVCKPVEREVQKHSASLQATADLVNPGIVKGHPSWTLSGRNV